MKTCSVVRVAKCVGLAVASLAVAASGIHAGEAADAAARARAAEMDAKAAAAAVEQAAMAREEAARYVTGTPGKWAPYGKTEKVAFLGVTTQPVDESLTRQLGLVNGTGLIVKHVEPGSPAAGKIEMHDVLRTFEGQILVNQEQLAVLVRTNKPGAAVSIELTRQAKPLTVSVKLAEKDMPPLMRSSTGMAIDPQMLRIFGGTNSPGRTHFKFMSSGGEAAAPSTSVGTSSRTVTSFLVGTVGTTTMHTDDHNTFTVKTEGDRKTLRVTTRDGKELFNGPINTDEERAKIPASLRDDVKELDNITKEVHVEVDAGN
jgi:hypothetical protein